MRLGIATGCHTNRPVGSRSQTSAREVAAAAAPSARLALAETRLPWGQGHPLRGRRLLLRFPSGRRCAFRAVTCRYLSSIVVGAERTYRCCWICACTNRRLCVLPGVFGGLWPALAQTRFSRRLPMKVIGRCTPKTQILCLCRPRACRPAALSPADHVTGGTVCAGLKGIDVNNRRGRG